MSLVRSPPPILKQEKQYIKAISLKNATKTELCLLFRAENETAAEQLARACLTASAIVTFVTPENIGQLASCV